MAYSKSALIRWQVDFYFSPSNLPSDVFLQSLMEPGTMWTPLKKIMRFPRMQAMGATDVATVANALAGSAIVELDRTGYFIRPRVNPPAHFVAFPPVVAPPVFRPLHTIPAFLPASAAMPIHTVQHMDGAHGNRKVAVGMGMGGVPFKLPADNRLHFQGQSGIGNPTQFDTWNQTGARHGGVSAGMPPHASMPSHANMPPHANMLRHAGMPPHASMPPHPNVPPHPNMPPYPNMPLHSNMPPHPNMPPHAGMPFMMGAMPPQAIAPVSVGMVSQAPVWNPPVTFGMMHGMANAVPRYLADPMMGAAPRTSTPDANFQNAAMCHGGPPGFMPKLRNAEKGTSQLALDVQEPVNHVDGVVGFRGNLDSGVPSSKNVGTSVRSGVENGIVENVTVMEEEAAREQPSCIMFGNPPIVVPLSGSACLQYRIPEEWVNSTVSKAEDKAEGCNYNGMEDDMPAQSVNGSGSHDDGRGSSGIASDVSATSPPEEVHEDNVRRRMWGEGRGYSSSGQRWERLRREVRSAPSEMSTETITDGRKSPESNGKSSSWSRGRGGQRVDMDSGGGCEGRVDYGGKTRNWNQKRQWRSRHRGSGKGNKGIARGPRVNTKKMYFPALPGARDGTTSMVPGMTSAVERTYKEALGVGVMGGEENGYVGGGDMI